jgi:glycerol-3-phosphate acyltransferase PlsY
VTEVAIAVAIGYLLGSVPSGLVVGYVWLRRDIRESGSGKTGTTNVLRTAGKLPAALVLVADIAKGAVPALVGTYLLDSDWAAASGAFAAVVGHIWPVFAGFRGGRGIATSFGGILAMTPLLALAFLAAGAVLVGATRIMSVMSVVTTPLAAAVIGALAIAGELPAAYGWYALAVTILVEYKHIPNIRRLLAGTEPKLGQGGGRAATG